MQVYVIFNPDLYDIIQIFLHAEVMPKVSFTITGMGMNYDLPCQPVGYSTIYASGWLIEPVISYLLNRKDLMANQNGLSMKTGRILSTSSYD